MFVLHQQDVQQKDFKLPKLAAKLVGFRDEIVNGRGFVLLRGLPVQDWSVEEIATAYWGMGTYWGKAQPQNRLHHLLGHVKVRHMPSKLNCALHVCLVTHKDLHVMLGHAHAPKIDCGLPMYVSTSHRYDD